MELLLDGTGERLVGRTPGSGEGEEDSKSDWTGMIFFFFFFLVSFLFWVKIPEVASLYEGRLD